MHARVIFPPRAKRNPRAVNIHPGVVSPLEKRETRESSVKLMNSERGLDVRWRLFLSLSLSLVGNYRFRRLDVAFDKLARTTRRGIFSPFWRVVSFLFNSSIFSLCHFNRVILEIKRWNCRYRVCYLSHVGREHSFFFIFFFFFFFFRAQFPTIKLNLAPLNNINANI